jgi:UDP-glucuronate decarboxylase
MLVGQLAELVVIEMTGARVEIEHRDLPDDDPEVGRPDTGTARSILAGEPRVTMEDGLQSTIGHARELLAIPGNNPRKVVGIDGAVS